MINKQCKITARWLIVTRSPNVYGKLQVMFPVLRVEIALLPMAAVALVFSTQDPQPLPPEVELYNNQITSPALLVDHPKVVDNLVMQYNLLLPVKVEVVDVCLNLHQVVVDSLHLTLVAVLNVNLCLLAVVMTAGIALATV